MKIGQELLESLEANIKRIDETQHQRRVDQTDPGDCYLSEWAENTMRRIYSEKIAILKNKGLAYFTVLADLEGNVVADHAIKTRYGYAYHLDDGRWISAYLKPENLAKKGFKEISIQKVAWVSDEGHTFPSDTNYWTGKGVK